MAKLPYRLIQIFANQPMDELGVRRVNISDFDADSSESEFWINAYATFTVIDFIAQLMGRIEWHTYENGVNKNGLEWHRLNYKPNTNQSAYDFWKEYYSKLLYYGEVLVVSVGDQLIIADDFTHHPEYAIREDIFECVRRGNLTFNRTFNRSEVIYQKYDALDCGTGLQSILAMYSNMISLSKEIYSETGGEKGMLDVATAANGPKDFEERYGDWINKRFKSYFSNRNAVMPLFKGMKYSPTQTKSPNNTASEDFIKLMDSAIVRTCNAFKIPPAIIRGEVAGMSDAFDVMLTTCADPLAKSTAAEFTAQEFTARQICDGCKIIAFTNNIKHTDIFSVADKFDKLFADGMSYNTLMKLLDMPEVNEPWAYEHHITKNYESVGKGGKHED